MLAVILSIILAWVGIRLPDAPNRIGGVKAASLADSLGFRAGDVIVDVAGTPTASLQAVDEALGRALDRPEGGAAPVPVRITRNGESRTVELPPGRAVQAFQGLEFPLPAKVGEVMMATPAYKAGLKAGDRVTAIEGEPIENWSDMTRIIQKHPGEEITLTIEREGRTLTVPVTPAAEPVDGKEVGKIGIAPATPETYVVRFGFLEGVAQGSRAAVSSVTMTVQGLVSLFSSPSNLSQISGPVAIIQASGDAAKAGWDRLLNLGVMLSVALMVFNLLPIPILDGGMVLLAVLEALRRRPLGDRGLAIYQGIGMAVLGTILIFVLINDPLRILQRHSALGRIENVGP